MEKEEEYIWGEECFCEGKIELSGLEVHKAIVSRDYQRLEELIKARTSLEVKNNFGLTPLHVAVHRRDFKAAEALIKYCTASHSHVHSVPLKLVALFMNYETNFNRTPTADELIINAQGERSALFQCIFKNAYDADLFSPAE